LELLDAASRAGENYPIAGLGWEMNQGCHPAASRRFRFLRFCMAWWTKNKPKERFYLLPGMGGRALRRKHRFFLKWSIAAGLVVSALVAIGLYFLNAHRH
jgi:hypothetical protein